MAGARSELARPLRHAGDREHTAFWHSRSTTWRYQRDSVVVLASFAALQGIVDVWIAIAAGVVAATLLLIDELLSRRVGSVIEPAALPLATPPHQP